MGSYGKIDASAYGHNIKTTSPRVVALETAVASWLASAKPGSFTSRDAVTLYDRALVQFGAWADRSEDRDNFEIALARCGYRAGVFVYDGEPRWILVLPGSVDTALTRLAEADAVQSCE